MEIFDAVTYNRHVQDMREKEYPSSKDKVYLDHGGTTLYAHSLIESYSNNLLTHLYGNPHSSSTPSTLSSNSVSSIRRKALHFFHADPTEYDLIFVPNATAAIKLVMESFRDLASSSYGGKPGMKGRFWYGYHKDAHTSLVGVREVTGGLHQCFGSDEEVEEWLKCTKPIHNGHNQEPAQLGLFAFPGQSNMTGRRLPLNWCGKLRSSTLGNTTYSLLDAAALATTCPIDLSDASKAPDFMCISFYKIFGFPDLGALIVRKSSGHILQWRKYFGGGTVDMVVCMNDSWHARKDYGFGSRYELHDQFEDGTVAFHDVIALGLAMEVHEKLFSSMQNISFHTANLAKQLYIGLLALTHSTGFPICQIYKDAAATYGDTVTQGATFAFNIQDPSGKLIPYTIVEKLADSQHIYLRSGGLCNPGGIATHLNLAPWEMKRAYSAGHRCGYATELVSGKPTGVVRVSLGAMSTALDVKAFVDFVRMTFMDMPATIVVSSLRTCGREEERPS